MWQRIVKGRLIQPTSITQGDETFYELPLDGTFLEEIEKDGSYLTEQEYEGEYND